MTTTSPAPSIPAPGPAPTAAPRGRVSAAARRLLQGTPGRMRLFGALAVLAAVVLGAVSANALLASRAAVQRAANNTAQVVRVQSVHVDLLRADALATNAFLVGGLEPADQRARYDAAMASVARALTEAAAAQPADARALGALSQQVQTYAALVQQGRSNNRLGLPIGAQYVRQASAGLRADAIPIVTAITDANQRRAAAEFERTDARWQLGAGAVSLVVLVLVAVWLARRTHRFVNVSLAAAFALLLLALFAANSVIGSIATTTATVARDDYARTVALAEIRTAANDARATESLTLIARGSGATLEKTWQADAGRVQATLTQARLGTDTWAAYTSVHQQIRRLDDGGQWDAAVRLATTTEPTGAGPRFDAFDTEVTGARDAASASAVGTLGDVGALAPLYAVLVALAAVVAGWLVVRGIGQRVGEYA
ncbi:MAG TPA: hypothetical protein VFJ94_09410 [Intrasporangium sp.]|uniref:hypothetical protein n=1 Tax=Intrasporangium sp. TaxID=1925024 RepID=UPI002D76D09C|nr:hypothetical protein [Intrasporangium sp.]HET7398725.1 hypothetical protein [Intrasporangium sp.]